MTKRILIGIGGFLILSFSLLGQGTEKIQETEIKKIVVGAMHSDSGYLGVSIRDVDSEDVGALSLPAEKGAYIERVEEDSPAYEAGLAEGDVVVEYAGDSVSSVRQFQRLVSETPPGREVRLEVWRSGSSAELNATIGERDGNYTWMGGDHPEIHIDEKIIPKFHSDDHAFFFDGHGLHPAGKKPRLGVQVAELTDQMAEFLGISGREGVLILATLPSTPAAAAGLRAGDVILSINGHEVRSPAELIRNLTDGENDIELARDRVVSNIQVSLEGDASDSDDTLEM